MHRDWRARAFGLLVDTGGRDWGRVAVTALLIAAIFASVGATMISTVPGIEPDMHALCIRVEFLAAVLFTIEYALRIWTAPESDPRFKPSRQRLRYAGSFLGVVDLVVILPAWLGLVATVGRDWFVIDSLLPLLKVARYAPGLALLAAVFRNEGRALLAALTVMLVLLVLTSGVIYALEHEAQPRLFGSIPQSLWWGVVTMATIGYGDMVPVTAAGKAFGSMVILLGIAVFAVPAGIFANGFATELRKRDFLVTWQAVAKVPLFHGLDATRIAAIARLLRPQMVPELADIVRRGETADAMYFIVSGEVEVQVKPESVRLRAGHYFGEIALLKDVQRTTTVTAVRDTRLLVLSVADFRRLLADFPEIRDAITVVAERRLAETGAPARESATG